MHERRFISSYTVVEQTTNRLAFDVMMDLRFIFKRILVPLGVIEGILIISFVILSLVGAFVRDSSFSIFFIAMITLVAILVVVLVLFRPLSRGITSIILEKNSGKFSISTQFAKQRFRAINTQLFYPLDALKSLEMISANELRGPGASIIRGMFKGMYLLRFKRFLPMPMPMPMRYQGNSRTIPLQDSVILFADSQPEQVQELKTLIEGFLNSSSIMPGFSNDEQFLQPTNFSANLACPRCGYKYTGNTKISFCPNCGESLEIA